MKTILSVDDDAVNQTVIEFLLEGHGYTVVQAMDGLEALEYLRTAPSLPDLVLMDCMMPRLSGYDATRRIRELYPAHLPVIMISAKASKEDIIQGLQCQANEYVTKPFDKEELLARIETHIKLNELREEQERVDCKKALFKLAVPQDLVIPEAEPVVALAAVGEDVESMKAFIDFLARKFNHSPVPTRTGCFCSLAVGEVQSTAIYSVQFIKALIEYVDSNHYSPVTVFVALGQAKSALYEGDVPALLVYGPVIDAIDRLHSTAKAASVGSSVVCSKRFWDLIRFQSEGLRVLLHAEDCVVSTLCPEAELVDSLDKRAPVVPITSEETLVRLSLDKERLLVQLARGPVGIDVAKRVEFQQLVGEYNRAPCEVAGKAVTRFLQSCVATGSDNEDLESTIERLNAQTVDLESQYKAQTACVNETLRKVLQLEALNEMLFLEIKRRQFEQRGLS